jgi:DNA-binding transcriptional regulator YhcF (GntR family)
MAGYDHRASDSSGALHLTPSSEDVARASAPPARAFATEGQLDLEGLTIDRAGEVPIGVQLAWALRARIGDGRLAPGRRLPGLRELADMLGINANTARAVYQRLEQEGLIDSRQGTGTFVASGTPESSAVGRIAADAARQARQTGVDPREVAAALYVTSEPPVDLAAQNAALAAGRRSELRAQIAALEQTLSEIQARHPGLIPTPAASLRQAGPRLLGVAELERVRAQLVRRLATAEPLLETPPESMQTVIRERDELERAASRVARPKQTKSPSSKTSKGKSSASKRTAGTPARTRPSTA